MFGRVAVCLFPSDLTREFMDEGQGHTPMCVIKYAVVVKIEHDYIQKIDVL